MRFRNLIIAGVLALVAIVPLSAYADDSGCVTVNTGDQGKYFTVSLSRSGNQGTAVVKLNDGVKLCNDENMVFESYSFSSNWSGNTDAAGLTSSFPQTEAYANHFTFGKDDTTKTVTVQTPDACHGTQMDVYVGNDEFGSLNNETSATAGLIYGKLFKANGTCKTADNTTSTIVNNTTNNISSSTVAELPTTGIENGSLIMLPIFGLATYLVVRRLQRR